MALPGPLIHSPHLGNKQTNICLSMHVCVCVSAHAMVVVWRSEGNLCELALSFFPRWVLGIQLRSLDLAASTFLSTVPPSPAQPSSSLGSMLTTAFKIRTYLIRVFQTAFGNLFPAHSSPWMLGLGSKSHSSITQASSCYSCPISHRPHLVSHILGGRQCLTE